MPSPICFLAGPARILAASPLLWGVAGPQQASREVRIQQDDFVLSRQPDLATRDRLFSSDDTLYMWLGVAQGLDRNAVQRASWRLEGPGGTLAGQLEPGLGGMTAELPLSALESPERTWVWSAEAVLGDRVLASASSEIEIEILAPRAHFEAVCTDGEAPMKVWFEDRSIGLVTSRAWDFGDGTHSNEGSPTHVYRAPGSFQPRLTVANPAGTSSYTVKTPVEVREQDLALFYGMNASENAWWQRGIAFADAMARASEFNQVVNGLIEREPVALILHGELGAGWPDVTMLPAGSKAGARLFGSMGGSMPDGRAQPYVLTWEGTGSCRLHGTGVIAETNRSSNRVEVRVDPTTGGGDALLLWILDSSDPADPVRNAHVWLPGTEGERPILWQPFVEKLQAMNGGRGPCTWRAMDWNHANQYGRVGGGAPFVFDFAGRITPASASQGTKRGVCPEFQVALCNAVGANLQLNVPHPANGMSDADYETFLRDVFTRIRDGSPAIPGVNGGRPFEPLAPHLRLVIEFSNELWNGAFPVSKWLDACALASGRTFEQETAFQIQRVFDIADEVFAGPDAARLDKFVGGWLGDAGFLFEVLSALGPGVHVDSAGPAFYFGPRKADVARWMRDAIPGSCPNCPTPEGVLESARRRIDELDLRLLEHQLAVTAHTNPDGTNPRLVLYEAGSSFAAGYQPWGPAACDAQRLQGLYDAYVDGLVPEFIARGVSEVLWYSFMMNGDSQGSAGPFGHWESMDQSLTLPVPDVYRDEGIPKAAAIYRLPPRRVP